MGGHHPRHKALVHPVEVEKARGQAADEKNDCEHSEADLKNTGELALIHVHDVGHGRQVDEGENAVDQEC